MVAIIKMGSSVRKIFLYNEEKIKKENAQLLAACNYPKGLGEISPEIRIKYLQKLTRLNTKAKRNSVHISLNFSQEDQLNKEQLVLLSSEYMKGIGLENQPYLIYRHTDAGHPHIHLVTTNIRLDGKRLFSLKIGVFKSFATCRAIEKQFGLLPAGMRENSIHAVDQDRVFRVEYGKSETKRAIGTVLHHVLDNYRFTSLEELNAVLKSYNILADRGGRNSPTYRARGLLYRVLDEKGKKIGVPIKSSAFDCKATLNAVEARFAENRILRKKYEGAVRAVIDLTVFRYAPKTMEQLSNQLEKQGVVLVKSGSLQGQKVDLTYVDHRNQTVFRGLDLGMPYSAQGILKRLGNQQTASNAVEDNFLTFQEEVAFNPRVDKGQQPLKRYDLSDFSRKNLLREVAEPQEDFSRVPREWNRRKRKKKKKLSSH